MKKYLLSNMFCMVFVLLFASCSSHDAKDFSGSWQKLNTFPDKATAILLVEPHIFKPLAIDLTVMGLLKRWAKEAGMPVDYEYSDDFTLCSKVSTINRNNIYLAVDDLDHVYASYGILITIHNGTIFVVSRKDPHLDSLILEKSTSKQASNSQNYSGTNKKTSNSKLLTSPLQPMAMPSFSSEQPTPKLDQSSKPVNPPASALPVAVKSAVIKGDAPAPAPAVKEPVSRLAKKTNTDSASVDFSAEPKQQSNNNSVSDTKTGKTTTPADKAILIHKLKRRSQQDIEN